MAHSQHSSPYVSPALGPTNPWSQQTLTGTFRPPPPPPPSQRGGAVGMNAAAPFSGQSNWNEATGPEDYGTYTPGVGYTPPQHYTEASMPANEEISVPDHIACSMAVDNIMEQIVYEVQRERDMYSFHHESNRALEEALKREQLCRQETQRFIDGAERAVAGVRELLEAYDKLIAELTAQQQRSKK